jgi:hypothetical protein
MMEVRCCCEPAKLLGYLPVEDRFAHAGASIVRITAPRWSTALDEVVDHGQRIELTIDELLEGGEITGRLAVRSDDTPLYLLRRISGFVEVH